MAFAYRLALGSDEHTETCIRRFIYRTLYFKSQTLFRERIFCGACTTLYKSNYVFASSISKVDGFPSPAPVARRLASSTHHFFLDFIQVDGFSHFLPLNIRLFLSDLDADTVSPPSNLLKQRLGITAGDVSFVLRCSLRHIQRMNEHQPRF